MRVRRLLTLMLMTAMAFVSGSSVAAALCQHQDAQQHQAALYGENEAEAAAAQLEEAAGAFKAKQATSIDAGSFALPAFVLPSSSIALDRSTEEQALTLAGDAPRVPSLAIAPLLEPPAA